MRVEFPTNQTLPYERFKRDPQPAEVLAWLKTHRYIWYQAPMDHRTSRLEMVSKLKLWSKSPERFAVSVIHYAGFDTFRFRIDESHLDRIRIPNPLWWHGITATVSHEYRLSNGFTSVDSNRGQIKRFGCWDGSQQTFPSIISSGICLYQSNGNVLSMRSLSDAIRHCQFHNMRLTISHGNRAKILVREKAETGDSQ